VAEAALDAIGECGEPVAADLVRLHRREVRCVVRLLMRTLAEVPAHRVAVLYGASEPYARLLAEHLGAAGITANGTAVRPVIERAFPRTLLGLLALPDYRWRRDVPAGVIAQARDLSPWDGGLGIKPLGGQGLHGFTDFSSRIRTASNTRPSDRSPRCRWERMASMAACMSASRCRSR
jgi:hypothetical protein